MPQSILSASAVSFEYPERVILEAVDLRVHAGDRIALVGANGSGKSTLLRLLTGLDHPTSGSVSRYPGARVAWLPQASGTDDHRTVRDELAELAGIGAAEREMDHLTDRLAAGDLEAVDAQAAAVERWAALGGGDFDARLGSALTEVGIDGDWSDRNLDTLSGGQAARVRLAALGLARVDCALLDEPSNHLDSEGLEILETAILEAPFATVFASHDRSLLERVATDVVELDRTGARLYRGGWDSYRREREAERRIADRTYEEAVSERDRLTALERRIRRQADTGRRRAKGRTDERDKFIRHMAIESAEKNTAAGGIAKRADAIEIPDKLWREDLSRLLLDAAQPVHSPAIAVLRGAVVARGEWRMAPIDMTIAPGERILLSGPNGSGKSSLIAALAGRTGLAAGGIDRPSSIRITELAQRESLFAGTGGTLIERFRQLSGLNETEARTALANMRLGAGTVTREPERLSPGERTRAELALLARLPAACLLLDEPSNHLDIEALGVLESALGGWTGALVLASHDLALRERVETDRTIDLEGFVAQPTRSSTSSSRASTSSSS